MLVAHIGSKTACGATIITDSPDTFADDPTIENTTFYFPSTQLPYTEQIIAVNGNGVSISYYPYYITTAEGKVYQSRTDEEEKTPRIWTRSAENIEAFWGEDAILKVSLRRKYDAK